MIFRNLKTWGSGGKPMVARGGHSPRIAGEMPGCTQGELLNLQGTFRVPGKQLPPLPLRCHEVNWKQTLPTASENAIEAGW